MSPEEYAAFTGKMSCPAEQYKEKAAVTAPMDVVARIQQGNWTDADVSEAVAEIMRLRDLVLRMRECLDVYRQGREPDVDYLESLCRR